ncbi:MAG TPA: cytochrome c peroxidase [Verrucomicrobiales bacterium]|nr:cytochrome c peroxidase [Verrucomicrobiales bacterium]
MAGGLLCLLGSLQIGWSQAPEEDPEAQFFEAAVLRDLFSKYHTGLPKTMPGAEGSTPPMVELGRRLFHEKRLSADGTVSCNSCHALDEGGAGADGRPVPVGVHGHLGRRNAPTVFNAGFQIAQFWDGRAATLEEQARHPLLNEIEMGMPDEASVVQVLQEEADYKTAFREAFPDQSDPLVFENVLKAIAAFERTLISRSRFDDFIEGDDEALTLPERRGAYRFWSLGCRGCHTGVFFGGQSFARIGNVTAYGNLEDRGRFEVTGNPDDEMVFKVPSLSNVAATAPYFHDGRIEDLPAAVREMFRLQVGIDAPDQIQADLVEFLGALTDKRLELDEGNTGRPGERAGERR